MLPLIGGGVSLQRVVVEPIGAAAVFLFCWLVSLLGKQTSTIGSQWCPAAISATVGTCGSMTFGYLAQVALFGQTPDLLSLLGAGVMLLSVAVMVAARAPPPSVSACCTTTSCDAELAKASSAQSAPAAAELQQPEDADDDTHSLGSFIASEFAQREAAVAPMLRPRRAVTAPASAEVAKARVIGAAMVLPGAEA